MLFFDLLTWIFRFDNWENLRRESKTIYDILKITEEVSIMRFHQKPSPKNFFLKLLLAATIWLLIIFFCELFVKFYLMYS